MSEANWKYLAAATLIAVVLGDFCIYKCSANALSLIFYLNVTLIAPLVALCVYFWSTGRGSAYLNIPGKRKYSKSSLTHVVSRIGGYYAVGLILLSLGFASLVFENSGLPMLVAFTVLAILVFIYGMAKGLRTEKDLESPYRPRGRLATVTVLAITLMAVICPSAIGAASDGPVGDVVIDVGDDSVSVRAPFFDHHFSYSDIESCTVEEDFDFGTRTMGYAAFGIVSGKWHNGELGDYRLAAYSGCRTCIVLTVDGSDYVFNQSDRGSTLAVYQSILQHI